MVSMTTYTTTTARSFYVKRIPPDGRLGWIGPIRSRNQAGKEAAAWRDPGWIDTEIHLGYDHVKAEVRAWQKEANARRGES